MTTLVKSQGKYIRTSPKKLAPVVAAIRGKKASEAELELSLINKGSVPAIKKVLKAAIADAEHNFNLKKESLIVKTASVDEGPRLKRYQPRARGMANSILKRTSHITIVLEGEGGKQAPKKTEIPTVAVSSEQEARGVLKEEAKPEATHEEALTAANPEPGKKIFRRKTG